MNEYRVTTTKVFIESLRAFNNGARLIANRGGTRSGKTYSLVMLLVILAMNKARTIDIVSETIPHLMRGCMQDADEIVTNMGLHECGEVIENKTHHTLTFRNGSVVRFFSADTWGKVKGANRDILFVNEANNVEWEVFRQLDVRTKCNIFIDWNPDSEFWFERKGLSEREDTVQIISTYKDNPFLSDTQIKAIEAYRDDEQWWRVYGLGEVGQHKGVIYTNWAQVAEIPKHARLIARGLDFGYTDPTAIVAVYEADGALWLDEECYTVGLTNDAIADVLLALPNSGAHIIADSAEQKSIDEIRNHGVRNIEGAYKGADSVRYGIQLLQQQKLKVTQRSLNLIRELRNYKWAQNKTTGELLNVPNKNQHFDHALDAVRYVAIRFIHSRRPVKLPRIKVGHIC